jgi:hypothetical protein
MMDKLLPCPMCGNNHEPKIVSSYDIDTEDLGNDEFFAVFCDAGAGLLEVHKGCGASGGYAKTKELAVSKWNTRQQLTKPADVQILIDALREISYSHDGYARKKAEQVLAAYNKATPDNLGDKDE